MVDLGRIELPSLQCECSVLPLYDRPKGKFRRKLGWDCSIFTHPNFHASGGN